MIAVQKNPATLIDLMNFDGKAELINGRIIPIMPTGFLPARIAKRILLQLDAGVQSLGYGEAFGDALGYGIDPPLLSGRQSFSPDVSFYSGPLPDNLMGFIEGAPDFAVEVRSENDYGPAADRACAAKRADYFEAGTSVVWDVDPIAKAIHAFTKDSQTTPRVFQLGDVANAEPAVPGWTLSTKELFT